MFRVRRAFSNVVESGKAAKAWDDHKKWRRFRDGASALVDAKRVRVKAGDGGNGRASGLSESKKEFAGPDGGDGGAGGHVLFKVDEQVSSLEAVKSVEQAECGGKGGKFKMAGKCAEHHVVAVPCGTIVRNVADRSVVAELLSEGSIFLAARGGAGGKGNAYFKSSLNQMPRTAEIGGKGEQFVYELELKHSSDVGLVGLPNAGKSTLLRAITRARPKVASYPFTTLNPHVGVVRFDDFRSVKVADVPGLIEDAHKNRGLGIDFLRHIERCSCFLYVVDVSESSANETLGVLKGELEAYKEGLSSRPHAIVANKMDLDESEENFEAFRESVRKIKGEEDTPIFAISAKIRLNCEPVVSYMRQMCDDNKAD